ncbi:glycoside hydrolase family 43 protein [Sphingosinicella sp. BN140058]|uniref:glycoside hydrolase family 43 protein n=1 Tax=Sphingosinicella sp. BN140058 TaxID=1892855 RepID=UPI0010118B58|nr:glycoside hydrolase family 43 protein [Sphingosinicella sp. BN140058]QAY78735.1 arabinan endo-1,5-alpha-L-arabinosidase [Sphingosinicella sp. BN140058]
MFRRSAHAALILAASLGGAGTASAANPIVPGWYADPEIRVFDGRYWIYPTYSDDYGAPDVTKHFTPAQTEARKRKTVRPSYGKQTFFNAFSSPDLVHWSKHSHVFDVENADWAAYAIWAPSVIAANGRYYMFFSANDIQSDKELGGIGLAVSDTPAGPFKDALGKPLIDAFHNGAQPIDPFAFRDKDGQVYLYYGGWKHCNVVRLSPDLTSVVPFPDGTTYKEITPPGYVEGSFVIERGGTYYLMWSEGGWTGPDYSVAYAMGPSPTGPFKPMGKILAQDFRIARGAGHHSVVNVPGTDEWYIAYHRRPLDTDRGEHRQVAIDRMHFNADGTIRPIVMTNEGVAPRPIAAAARPNGK